MTRWLRNDFKVGPEYCGTSAAVADAWIETSDPRILGAGPGNFDWWSALNDPVINRLVERAYGQNLTLREAGFRVLAARAQAAIAVGNVFPQAQSVDGSYSRSGVPLIEQPLLAPLPEFKRDFDDWVLSGNLSWELDLWGKFRRAVAAADANLNASVREYDAVLVCLLAEVVTAYVDIRTAQTRLQFMRANVEFQDGSLELTQIKADEGKTGYVSVAAAQSIMELTRTQIGPLEADLRQASNRLCTLLGIPTIDLLPELGAGNIPVAPAEVAIGIPADLLRRRPDVRAAERQVAVESEQIGIALTDLYPAFSITGTIGLGAQNLSQIFDPGARFSAVGPGFHWNILNYGRILNNVRSQRADFRESVTNYRNTVLEANQEVEDALVAFQKSQQQAEALTGSAEAMQRALDLELIRFVEGENNFTGVFVFQSVLVQQQDQLAQARGSVITSLVQLYKALGGGWQVRCYGFPAVEAPVLIVPAFESETIELPAPETEEQEAIEEAEAAAEEVAAEGAILLPPSQPE
jgi:NodT family efflux transporter outer membrane factor (OMF) lipoprotein